MRTYATLLALCLSMGLSAVGCTKVSPPPPSPGELTTAALTAAKDATAVVVGTIVDAKIKELQDTHPSTAVHEFTLEVARKLSGQDVSGKLTVVYSTRSEREQTAFATGQQYVVVLRKEATPAGWAATFVAPWSEALEQSLRK
ncbi:MAG: hypothetical protein QM765_32185 [Myxococcales bacterium]